MPADDNNFIVRDAIVAIFGMIFAGIFFSSDISFHFIYGLWCSFIGLAGLLHAPAHYFSEAKPHKKVCIWIVYWCLLFAIAGWFSWWSYRIVHPLPPKVAEEWQPPELPKGCASIRFQLGRSIESSQDIPISELTNGPVGELPLKGQFIIAAYVKENRLYIQATIPITPLQNPVLISNDSNRKIPDFWDQNNDENAFEVVDEENLPVFQVLYKNPNDVVVCGIFKFPQITPQTTIIAFDEVYVHVYDTPNPMAIYNVIKATPRKSLFKYPSKLHPHELAE